MGTLSEGAAAMVEPGYDDADEVKITIDVSPSPDDVRRVAEGLFDSAEALLGTGYRRRPFSVFLRGPDGSLLGGLNARLVFGDLHVDQLWCAPDVRGNGHATQLLAQAEAFAREHGAETALLNTFDAGLVTFYERRGYRTIGEVAGLAAKRPVYFMAKTL